jgi:hypothetical protein
VDVSVAEMLTLDQLVIPHWIRFQEQDDPLAALLPLSFSAPVVSASDLPSFATGSFLRKVRKMNLINVKAVETMRALHFHATEISDACQQVSPGSGIWITNTTLGGVDCLHSWNPPGDSEICLLDARRPLVRWLTNLREAAVQQPGLRSYLEALCDQIGKTFNSKIDELLVTWSNSAEVDAELRPPLSNTGAPATWLYTYMEGHRTVPDD